jgi:ABC-2 type transport system ATP-binding protein
VAGVSAVRRDGQLVQLEVKGSVEPLLQVLSGCHVTKLLSREPSLEELFLALYGEHTDAG